MYTAEVGDLILGLLSSYHILMLVFAFSIMSSYLLLGVISIRTMRSRSPGDSKASTRVPRGLTAFRPRAARSYEAGL